MSAESKSFICHDLSPAGLSSASFDAGTLPIESGLNSTHLTSLFEIGVVFGLIVAAVWTQFGLVNSCFILLTTFSVLAFSIRRGFSLRDLGLAFPLKGAFPIFVFGAVIVVAIRILGPVTLNIGGPAFAVPAGKAWLYGVWALLQEFILQSFFFVRLESVVGSRRATLIAALLLAAVHVPSPVLTVASFVGGLLFCEMFRRYRNLFPVGLIHAALGLTIAASLPDAWLHHMRVGIGFLSYHP
jgi:hypothetical protein